MVRPRIKIAFLIRSLGEGGSERQLYELVRGLDPERFSVSVLTFYDEGVYAHLLKEVPSVKYVPLHKKSRWAFLTFLRNLYKVLRSLEPDVFHGYLGTSNLCLALLKPFFPKTQLVWGVRSWGRGLNQNHLLSRLQWWAECRLSRLTNLVISNSQAGRDFCVAHGFPRNRSIVIPNGVDTYRFNMDPLKRETQRRLWNISEKEILIGISARIDVFKDHANFLRSMKHVCEIKPNVKIAIAGAGDRNLEKHLHQIASDSGISDRILWLGNIQNLSEFYNALDLCVSSSTVEGFSNSIAEAMACGVPCVVTDVGDSKQLIGNTGLAVPPGDPDRLAKACIELIDKAHTSGGALSISCRSRVENSYSVWQLITRTSTLLEQLSRPLAEFRQT